MFTIFHTKLESIKTQFFKMTFDLHVMLNGQGRRFDSIWYDVSTRYSKQVVSDFIECFKLKAELTVRRGPRTLSVCID